MSSQLGAISSVNTLIGSLFTQPHGDLASRLNSRITVPILAVSAGLLLTTHYWNDPINCWIPAEFPKNWADYVNQYCYVHGTYFSSLNEQLHPDVQERQRISIGYYQWVPYVLAAQAIFFYIPKFVWKMLSKFSGYNMPAYIRYIDMIWRKIESDNFESRMDVMERKGAVYLWEVIQLSKQRTRGQLSLYYLFYTVFQACNATVMFLWLNRFMDSPSYAWSGPSILIDLYHGLSWMETGHFPRIAHCDFTRRNLVTAQTETVMCVLTLNLYYEKLLLFLWFWMLFVATVSVLNCINWAFVMCMHSSRNKLRWFLRLHAISSSDRFFKALGPDGAFILHQISLNIDEYPASLLTIGLYNLIGQSENETRHLLAKNVKGGGVVA